jgi:hypothetical protein
MERVRVQWRHQAPVPALRDGDVVGWDYVATDTGTIGRGYLLVDVGVKLIVPPIWIQRGDPIWYVDLAIVTHEDDLFCVVDRHVDVFVPTDGQPYRTLGLDEVADALENGESRMSRSSTVCGAGNDSWTRICIGSGTLTTRRNSHLDTLMCSLVGGTFRLRPLQRWRDWGMKPSRSRTRPTLDLRVAIYVVADGRRRLVVPRLNPCPLRERAGRGSSRSSRSGLARFRRPRGDHTGSSRRSFAGCLPTSG